MLSVGRPLREWSQLEAISEEPSSGSSQQLGECQGRGEKGASSLDMAPIDSLQFACSHRALISFKEVYFLHSAFWNPAENSHIELVIEKHLKAVYKMDCKRNVVEIWKRRKQRSGANVHNANVPEGEPARVFCFLE